MACILASGLIIQSSRVVPRKLCLSSLHGDEGLFLLPDLKEALFMEKEKNTKLPLVDLIEVKPMQDGYRWVAITAMLFAIGIILHTVSPNVGGRDTELDYRHVFHRHQLDEPYFGRRLWASALLPVSRWCRRRSRRSLWAISPASFRAPSPAAFW